LPFFQALDALSQIEEFSGIDAYDCCKQDLEQNQHGDQPKDGRAAMLRG
jgi:hypothetical protein